MTQSTARLLWRGGTRRCPVCGRGRLFRRWVLMRARCPRCNLTFERIEGHWIGAIAINTILSFGLMLVAMIVGFIVLSPAEPFGPFTAIIAAIGLIAPIVFYPFSKTIWTAVDLVFRPLEPGEADWARLGPRSVSRRASRR